MLESIFTVDFFFSLVRMTTPILFVGLAAVIGGKANILCLAYEAMMLFGALGGVLGSAYSGNLFIGLASGILAGLIIAAIFGYFVLYLDTKPLLAGLALNTLGTAGTVYIVFLLTGRKLDTSTLNSLTFPNIDIPILENIPVIGDLLSGHNLLSYVSIIMIGVVYYFIFKTNLGLRIRAAGENPDAAESAGINVKKTKLFALIISGIFASLGGIYLSMAQMPYFVTNMSAGRGFIGIAAQNLSSGSPIGTALASAVFGATMAFGNLAQSFRLPSQFASVAPYLMTIIGSVIMGIREQKRNNLERGI